VALILRARERVAVPWKNGGGVTRTVAVHPPGSDLETFDWRVSIAEVRSSGPFSVFSGVERHMAVLRGQLSLSIDGRAPLILTADSAPLSFAGDVPVHGAALAGAVTDLNVMTRRGRCSAQLRHWAAGAAAPPAVHAAATLILALAPLTVRSFAGELQLEELDAAWLPEGMRGVQVSAPGGAGCYLAHFQGDGAR
jgi:environmental stress-induced protein Ves